MLLHPRLALLVLVGLPMMAQLDLPPQSVLVFLMGATAGWILAIPLVVVTMFALRLRPGSFVPGWLRLPLLGVLGTVLLYHLGQPYLAAALGSAALWGGMRGGLQV